MKTEKVAYQGELQYATLVSVIAKLSCVSPINQSFQRFREWVEFAQDAFSGHRKQLSGDSIIKNFNYIICLQ